MQIRNLKQALNLGRVLKFNHKAWLKSSRYEYRAKKKLKNDFERGFQCRWIMRPLKTPQKMREKIEISRL